MRPIEEHPRLSLVLPDGWQSESASDNTSNLAVKVATGIDLEIRPLVSIPIDNLLWVETVMRRNAPADCRLEKLALENRPSDTNLPAIFAHYQLRGQAGELLEERVAILYRVIHNGAEVVVRLAPGTTWQEHAGALLPVLMAGEIAWPTTESALVYTLLGMRD